MVHGNRKQLLGALLDLTAEQQQAAAAVLSKLERQVQAFDAVIQKAQRAAGEMEQGRPEGRADAATGGEGRGGSIPSEKLGECFPHGDEGAGDRQSALAGEGDAGSRRPPRSWKSDSTASCANSVGNG